MVSCFAYTTFLAWFVDEASGAAVYSEDTQRTPYIMTKQNNSTTTDLFCFHMLTAVLVRDGCRVCKTKTYRDSSKSNLYCDYTSTL